MESVNGWSAPHLRPQEGATPAAPGGHPSRSTRGSCASPNTPLPCRDIAKNALLRWRVFIYWTFLGVFDALVFFFGAYFMFENTTVASNGQVSTQMVLTA